MSDSVWRSVGVALLAFYGALAGAAEVYKGSGPNAANRTASLGINLADPQSYQPDFLFVDAGLKMRKWIPHSCSTYTWDNGKTIKVDAKGWVTSVPADTCPGAVILDGPGTPLGTYVLIWEGEGTLSAQLGPAGGLKCASSECRQTGDGGLQVRSRGIGPHKATFELKTQETTITDLRILAFNPGKPIRNISVIVPGGLTGSSKTNLNYTSWCRTARGPTDTKIPLATPGPGETCIDFAEVYWNRYRDPLNRIQNPAVLLHPVTLAELQNFRLLRAMDWMRTNESQVSSWSQRTHYQQQNQVESLHGVALEYLVALANVAGADLWVNVPHRADNNYVTHLAGFLRDNLHPALKVYAEYSNELWNDAFAQTGWVRDEGVRRQLAPSPWEARARCHSERAVEIADLFRSEFSGQTGRLVNVLAGQAANPDVGREMLSWHDAKLHFDAYAIAPYFGYALGGDPDVVNFSSNQVFANLSDKALPETRTWVANSVAMLKRFEPLRIRLIAYEAGPHLAGVGSLLDNDKMTQLFTSANRDERMGETLAGYLSMLKNEGMSEVCYFNFMGSFGKFGSWGARETEADNRAPKWLAMKRFMRSESCWWPACSRSEATVAPASLVTAALKKRVQTRRVSNIKTRKARPTQRRIVPR